MSDQFDVTCRRCSTVVTVTIPADRSVKPFSCPGCGGSLVVDAQMAATPLPQVHDAGTPRTGVVTTHLFGRFDSEPDEECAVCGNSLLAFFHDRCEQAEQVEPYDPT